MTATLSRRRGAAARAGDDDSPDPSERGTDPPHADPAQRLRHDFAAVRVSFTWFGIRKSLSAEQKAEAAEQFGAEGHFLTAAKKLLDNKHPAFQQVTGVRSRILSYFKGISLPYPEPGLRLVRQQDLDAVNSKLQELRQELGEAVDNLDQHFAQLKSAARDRLGRLFNSGDYPQTLRGLFAVDFDYPSVEPPQYLLRLNPHLFQQERQRIAERFDEAVRLAEEAFTSEFARLVSHLTERLSAGPDGQKKVFRDSAIGNLTEFFNRFKTLNVGSNAELERLVETAQQALTGVQPQAVRNNESLRQQVSTQLSAVQSVLDGLLVDQPRRRILRPAAIPGDVAGGGGAAP